MMTILRVRIEMPKIADHGNFVAWLDNNGRFNVEEGRAVIFNSYSGVMATMHKRTDHRIIDLLDEFNCSFTIEFFEQKHWKPYHKQIERQLSSLCDIV